MNEEVEKLMLDHMRAIRADMARLADSMRTMQSEMSAMRQHLAGVVTLQEHDHGDIATLKVRVDRIEQRLDLVE